MGLKAVSSNTGGGSPGVFTSLTATGLFTQAAEDSITAHAGGGKASATALSAVVNDHRVSVCATAGDSILMPPALVGQNHYVRNDGVAAMQVFGQGTDTINGVATATGISHANAMGVWYVCTTAGNWTTTAVDTISATVAFAGPAGTAANPSIYLAGDTGVGWYRNTSNQWTFAVGSGNKNLTLSSNGAVQADGSYIGWTTSATDSTAATEVRIGRNAVANTIDIRNAANACALRVFGNTTGTKALSLSHDGTNGIVDTTASAGLLSLGPTNASQVKIGTGFALTAPNTQTGATYTVAATDNYIISNVASTQTATFPAASSNTGRRIVYKTIQAQAVVSASSNVVPLVGGGAGTAILAATAGKWAELVSDGTNWVIMAGN